VTPTRPSISTASTERLLVIEGKRVGANQAAGIATCVLLVACGGQDLSSADPDLLNTTPSYARDVRPILRQHCESCHASYGPILNGVELDAYQSAYSNRVRVVCTAVAEDRVSDYADALRPAPRLGVERPPCDGFAIDSMPPGTQPRLTAAEQLVLLRWTATGANP